MALIDCPECGGEVSNLADRCPKCGAPVTRIVGEVKDVGGEDASLGYLMSYNTFEDFKQAAERAFIEAKLDENDWNVSETARQLDMPRSNLYKKIEKHGLTNPRQT